MENERKTGCGCGKKGPVPSIIRSSQGNPVKPLRQELAEMIQVVQLRKLKTYKTRLQSPL